MITKKCQCCPNGKSHDINNMIIIGTSPNQIWACEKCAAEYTKIFPEDKDTALKGCRNCVDT